MTKLIVAAMLIALICTLSVSRETSAHSGYFRNTGNSLNLRDAPGGDSTVIGNVPARAVVKAFGHKGNWLKLRVLDNGQVGWAWLWNFDPSSYTPPPPAPPPAAQPELQTCFWNYWGRTVCAPYWIALEFYNAARYYGASYWMLMSVGACESDLSPNAYNAAGPTGIMQFYWSTIQGFGWPGASPWSVHDSAWVAAKMFAQGLGYTHWHCYRLLSGG